MNRLEITLCINCLKIENERTDIDIHRLDYKQNIKDNCNICQVGRGYDYVIIYKGDTNVKS